MSHKLWWILSEKQNREYHSKRNILGLLWRWVHLIWNKFLMSLGGVSQWDQSFADTESVTDMHVYLTFESPSPKPGNLKTVNMDYQIVNSFKKSKISGWIDRWRYTEICWFIYQRRSSKWPWSGTFASEGYHRGLSFNHLLSSVHISDTLRVQYG